VRSPILVPIAHFGPIGKVGALLGTKYEHPCIVCKDTIGTLIFFETCVFSAPKIDQKRSF